MNIRVSYDDPQFYWKASHTYTSYEDAVEHFEDFFAFCECEKDDDHFAISIQGPTFSSGCLTFEDKRCNYENILNRLDNCMALNETYTKMIDSRAPPDDRSTSSLSSVTSGNAHSDIDETFDRPKDPTKSGHNTPDEPEYEKVTL